MFKTAFSIVRTSAIGMYVAIEIIADGHKGIHGPGPRVSRRNDIFGESILGNLRSSHFGNVERTLSTFIGDTHTLESFFRFRERLGSVLALLPMRIIIFCVLRSFFNFDDDDT